MNSGSTKFSIDFSYGGFGLNSDSTAGWSTTDEVGYALNDGTSNQASAALSLSISRTLGPDEDLVPGNGDQCGSSTNCIPADYLTPTAQYLDEPFWNDVFLLEVHPQFAFYRFGSGQDEYVSAAPTRDFAAITVAELDGCAHGADPANVSSWCSIPVTTSFVKASGSLEARASRASAPRRKRARSLLSRLPPPRRPTFSQSTRSMQAARTRASVSGYPDNGFAARRKHVYAGLQFSPSNCNKYTSPTPVAEQCTGFRPNIAVYERDVFNDDQLPDRRNDDNQCRKRRRERGSVR